MRIPDPPFTTVPFVEEVDVWFREAGFDRATIGSSFEGRDIYSYTLNDVVVSSVAAEGASSTAETDNKKKTIWFQSLVHGNEALGLLSLLHTAALVADQKRASMEDMNNAGDRSVRVVFVPFLNVDGYILNRSFRVDGEEFGCRRTNLRHTCPLEAPNATGPCFLMSTTNNGVDLNRNFAADWKGPYASSSSETCTTNYRGTRAMSEPESRALRKALDDVRPFAAMGFHSRATRNRPPLLIHPYASKRPLSDMKVSDLRRFRSWAWYMNEKASEEARNVYALSESIPVGTSSENPRYFITGNAMESIGYTAGGSTLDYMYAHHGVTSFVLEVPSPCSTRWCGSAFSDIVTNHSRVHAVASWTLIQLSVFEDLAKDFSGPPLPQEASFIEWEEHTTDVYVSDSVFVTSIVLVGLFFLAHVFCRRRLYRLVSAILFSARVKSERST